MREDFKLGHADKIYKGGNILTMDANMLHAEAIAIKDGRILAIGSDQEVLNLVGPGTKTKNLYGRFVMPGLVESHTHALWGACRNLFDVYVGYNATFEMLTDAVRTIPAIPLFMAIAAFIPQGWTAEMRFFFISLILGLLGWP